MNFPIVFIIIAKILRKINKKSARFTVYILYIYNIRFWQNQIFVFIVNRRDLTFLLKAYTDIYYRWNNLQKFILAIL